MIVSPRDEKDQLTHGDVAAERHAAGVLQRRRGLRSTADDYLRFVEMLLRDGTADGVRVLSPESRSMRTDRLTDEQKRHLFLGAP